MEGRWSNLLSFVLSLPLSEEEAKQHFEKVARFNTTKHVKKKGRKRRATETN